MENNQNNIQPKEGILLESTAEVIKTQSRNNSPLFWVGLISAAFTAVVSGAVTANVTLPWWVGAIGTGLSAVLIYCNGNNPSLKDKY